ncbi:DUF4383 domain-containing protein [Mycolicibacterium sp. 120266]|uniref:DUF4383 domain-containing protein n=1 Tax=Mycolicibacterium sp. 120266 TaxID=3090601 RepID=UPI00299E5CDE|nr:DUF4383 domain-containing protein [Mycolicibacterium sp. 120266]MDX1871611.1 DUF4383 domain-containing protein [Mycolicibacterium sp. 120266]
MTTSTPHTRTHMPAVRIAALVVGALFLVVGIAGFIPGLTTHTDMLTWAGHHSGSMLLGVFAVSVLHNVVHLAFGIAGLLASRTGTAARGFLVVAGVIYLVLTLYGVVIDHASSANFVPLNTADNWLHLALGLAMVGLGVLLGRPAVHTDDGTIAPTDGLE